MRGPRGDVLRIRGWEDHLESTCVAMFLKKAASRGGLAFTCFRGVVVIASVSLRRTASHRAAHFSSQVHTTPNRHFPVPGCSPCSAAPCCKYAFDPRFRGARQRSAPLQSLKNRWICQSTEFSQCAFAKDWSQLSNQAGGSVCAIVYTRYLSTPYSKFTCTPRQWRPSRHIGSNGTRKSQLKIYGVTPKSAVVGKEREPVVIGFLFLVRRLRGQPAICDNG